MSYVIIPQDKKGDTFYSVPTDEISQIKQEFLETEQILRIYVKGFPAPLEVRTTDKDEHRKLVEEVIHAWSRRKRGAWTHVDKTGANVTLMTDHIATFFERKGILTVICLGMVYEFADPEGDVRHSLCAALFY